MGLFDDIPTQTLGNTAPKGLFDDIPDKPASNVGLIKGTKQIGYDVISGVGASLSKWVSDMHKLSTGQTKGEKQGLEVLTRPARTIFKGAISSPIAAVATPLLSVGQIITKKPQAFNFPGIGNFQSYQTQRSKLSSRYGKAVGTALPIFQEALNITTIPGAPKAISSLVKKIIPEAEQAPAVVRFLGDTSKNVSKSDLGTWEQMTKLQAAENALQYENPDSIGVQGLINKGMSVNEAQKSALNSIKERASTITPQEHYDMISNISRNIGEDPVDISKNLPNYLNKYSQFEKIAPQISETTGIPMEKMTLLRNDTLTNVNIKDMINDVKSMKWSQKLPDGSYKTAIGQLYEKYPGLQVYQKLIDPSSMLNKGPNIIEQELKDLGFSQVIPPEHLVEISPSYALSHLMGKEDLINRLEKIVMPVVNHEVDTSGVPVKIQNIINSIGSEGENIKGYKIGFSPLEYAPIIPKENALLPTQNWLGKLTDNLGLRRTQTDQINYAWQRKFEGLFNDQFSIGESSPGTPNAYIAGKDGTLYTTETLQPEFTKAGTSFVPAGKKDILDTLYDLKNRQGRISITELSTKNLKAVFNESEAEQLSQILRESRVLPSSLEGLGPNIINRLRTNKYFDDFYRATLAGHFTYSPGFAVRHTVKNQILGAFENKPINLLRFADTDVGQGLINRFPSLFGGETPSIEELKGLTDIMGKSTVALDPASEQWIYQNTDIPLQDTVIKRAIQSPNVFEKLIGYSQTQDTVDLARTFARKNGLELNQVFTDPQLSDQLKDLVTKTYGYKPGVLTSPAIKTLNTILFPIRFDAKVTALTADWYFKLPFMARSFVAQSIMDGITNAGTLQAQKFLQDNKQLVKTLYWTVPYFGFLNAFQDAINSAGDIAQPKKAAQLVFKTVTDVGMLGGLAFGILMREAQNQGIIPTEPYINPFKNKEELSYIPTGISGRTKSFVGTWLDFMWPHGTKVLDSFLPGKQAPIEKLLPSTPFYLPQKQHKKLQPGQTATERLFKR